MARSLGTNESPFQHSVEGAAVESKHRSNAKKDEDWAPGFLGAVMQGMSVTDATALVDVHITLPYKRRAHDEVFRRAWVEAAEIGTEFLEQEAARRAYHGTLEPVFYKGVECGQVRRYSDTLMIFLLKARKPTVYRDGEGSTNVNVQVNIFDDIERDIKLLTVDAAPAGGVPADGDAQPVDAPQPTHPAAAPEAD